jgi:hypothetical protein
VKSKDVLKLELNPKDIIVPSRYNGKPDCGYDIALIGLSRKNKLKVDEYLIYKNE